MKIGVVGAAGTLGSCAAFAILEKRLPGELWLFDMKRNVLLAHYMDLQIAASVMGRNERPRGRGFCGFCRLRCGREHRGSCPARDSKPHGIAV